MSSILLSLVNSDRSLFAASDVDANRRNAASAAFLGGLAGYELAQDYVVGETMVTQEET